MILRCQVCVHSEQTFQTRCSVRYVGLIPLIKKIRPDLPIIYRRYYVASLHVFHLTDVPLYSHIEIRSELIHNEGSAQEDGEHSSASVA